MREREEEQKERRMLEGENDRKEVIVFRGVRWIELEREERRARSLI